MEALNTRKIVANKIVLLDGISGSGKTMFSSILDSYSKNLLPKFDYGFEQIFILKELGYLDSKTAGQLSTLKLNQALYDSLISREVNFRFQDLSSIFRSSKRFVYLRRLLMNDYKKINSEFESNSHNVVIITHQLTIALIEFIKQNKEKIIYLQSVRNPVYLYKNWVASFDIICQTERDFTPWRKRNGHPIPWFIDNFDGNFNNLSKSEKAALSIVFLTERSLFMHKLMMKNSNYIAFNFEKFVINPSPYVMKMNELFEENSNSRVLNILKKEKVPRAKITQGKQRSIYSRYGQSVEKMDNGKYEKFMLDQIKMQVKSEIFKLFLESKEKYEGTFGKVSNYLID